MIYRRKKCNRKSNKAINDLIKRCSNIYLIYSNDIDKFLLLLRKEIYPYEYMHKWSRFNEWENPPFKKYYSRLNLSNINKEDYLHSPKVWNKFKTKNNDEYRN